MCAPALAAGKKSPNPHAVTAAEFQNDPLTYNGKVRARVAREVLNSEEGVVDRLRRLRCPLLVLHSVEDTLTSIDGSRMLIREAATPAADKVLDELQSGWHANPYVISAALDRWHEVARPFQLVGLHVPPRTHALRPRMPPPTTSHVRMHALR